MRRILLAAVMVLIGLVVVLYLPHRPRASTLSPHPRGLRKLAVRSLAFRPGARWPRRFTADGKDISPPVQWSHVPPHVKSFAVIVEDTDAPGPKAFIHWVIWDIPATLRGLPMGVKTVPHPSVPRGSRQGKNSFGNIGYGGPAPPPGKPHHYHILVYALNDMPPVPAGATAQKLILAMEGHLVAWGHTVGVYGR